MNTNTYGYFEQVYRHHSFTKAARAAMISPQGLTKAIRVLESELGVPLFDDSSGSQIPTPYGERFHEFACMAIEAREKLCRDLEAEKIRRSASVIRLCSSTGVLGALEDPIAAFEEAYPDIHVLLEDYPDYMCDQRLRDGLCDLALTVYPYAPDFETVQLYEDVHFCWMRESNALASQPELHLFDLADRTVVSVGQEYKGCVELMNRLEGEGIQLKCHKTSSEMVLIERQVKNGDGIGLTVRHQASLFEMDPSVVAIPLPELPWRFGVSYAKGHELSAAEHTFISFMAHQAADALCSR